MSHRWTDPGTLPSNNILNLYSTVKTKANGTHLFSTSWHFWFCVESMLHVGKRRRGHRSPQTRPAPSYLIRADPTQGVRVPLLSFLRTQSARWWGPKAESIGPKHVFMLQTSFYWFSWKQNPQSLTFAIWMYIFSKYQRVAMFLTLFISVCVCVYILYISIVLIILFDYIYTH